MSAYRGSFAQVACAALTIPTFYLLSVTAFAQEEEPPPAIAQDRGALEEILVTARKRTEKLQDVPISITAFSAKGLRDRNINNAYDLANFTPNFQLTPNLGRRLDQPNIRGQFGPLIGSTAPNASFFIDGVYVSGSIGSTSVANLERIEVLRGPQSAIFGRATFSGAVNYITRKATDEFEGQFDSKIGEDGRQELGGWVSGPIVKEKLFFYAGVNQTKWDGEWRNGLKNYDTIVGYSETGYPALGIDGPYGIEPFFGQFFWDANDTTGYPNDPPCVDGSNPDGCYWTRGDNRQVGGEKTNIGTFKLTWAALDNLEFNVKYERSEADDDHFVYNLVNPNNPSIQDSRCYHREGGGRTPTAGDPLDPRAGINSGGWLCGEIKSNDRFDPKLNLRSFERGVNNGAPFNGGDGVSEKTRFIGTDEKINRYFADAIYDVNDYEFLIRVARNDTDSEYVRDLDRSYALGPASSGLFEAYTNNDATDKSFEFRVASPGDQRLRWQAGYYWYKFDQSQEQRNFTGFGSNNLQGTGSERTVNNAIFGSLEIDLTDNWKFAFEGRYAKDEASRTTAEQDPFTVPDPSCSQSSPDENGQVTMNCEENFYSFSPRATLSWNVKEDESLTVYAQIAEGNKPGGYNFAFFDGDVRFDLVDFQEEVVIKEEKATTYELGAKGTYFDNRLSANVSAFYIDWKNQAINELNCIPQIPGGQFGCQANNIVRNAGKSSVKGLEVELDWYPTDYQTYTVAYGYADTELKEYVDKELANLKCPIECYDRDPNSPGLGVGNDPLTPEAMALIDELGDVSGNYAPRVPKHNVSLGQVYQRPFNSDAEWFVRNDFLYESKKYSTASNLNWTPSLWTWNARVGLEAETWTLTFYVDNVTDEGAALQIQNFPLFDYSQSYSGTYATGIPVEVDQTAFQILPRQSRNAGASFQYRFGQN